MEERGKPRTMLCGLSLKGSSSYLGRRLMKKFTAQIYKLCKYTNWFDWYIWTTRKHLQSSILRISLSVLCNQEFAVYFQFESFVLFHFYFWFLYYILSDRDDAFNIKPTQTGMQPILKCINAVAKNPTPCSSTWVGRIKADWLKRGAEQERGEQQSLQIGGSMGKKQS